MRVASWSRRRYFGAKTGLRVTAVTLAVGLVTFTVAVLQAQEAEAATDTVTNCSGSVSVSGSLPYEVANASPGDAIAFALSPPCNTITLTSPIVISENLTITGPGSDLLAVSGGGTTRTFQIISGNTVSISGLTLEDGNGVGQDSGEGGAIQNSGTLTVTDSILSDNSATGPGGQQPGAGGAIENDGTLTVTDSTLSHNNAYPGTNYAFGGAIANYGGTLTLTDSTVSDNTSQNYGGGIWVQSGGAFIQNATLSGNADPGAGGGAIGNGGTVTIDNSTLSGNTNDGYAGGAFWSYGTVQLEATIVADNPGGSCSNDGGTITDDGYNISDDATCAFSATGSTNDSATLDGSLGALAENGGPTETIALSPTSPAVDQVPAVDCPATDQRGAPRSTPCDIGAYDTDSAPFVELDVSGSQISGSAAALSYTTNAPGGIVAGTLVCTTVDGGTPISSSLAVGYYTVDGSSCSGLTSSDPTAYPIYASSYNGVPGGFAVSASPAWSISASPSPNVSGQVLMGTSCASSTFCVAVGNYSNGSVDQTFVESWNGTAWVVTSSPDQGSGINELDAVSCASPTFCVATGDYDNAGTDDTLVETWNGSSWSITSSPNETSSNNYLEAVSCTSTTSCMAAGYSVNGSGDVQTLVEKWNGTSWSITSSPNPSSHENFLNGVSCTSATGCVAVGEVFNGSVDQTLVETWNGTSWSVTSSPNQGSDGSNLNGVSCTGSTFCVAVGDYINGSDVNETLVETWNGTSWSLTSSPNNADSEDLLEGVSCTISTSCRAVGYYLPNSSFTNLTLLETWNGSSWSITSSPNQGTSDNYLYGVSCTSITSCVGAGYDLSPSVGDTLIEMPPLPVVSEVSPDTGYTTEGASVTITGSGFTGTTAVDFGTDNPGTIDVESDGTSLTVTAPPGSAGTVDVTVTAPGGISAQTPADQFTYTVEQTPTTVSCQPSCTNTVSTPLNDTSVAVTGDSGSSSSGPSTSLVVNTGTLSCGTSKTKNYDYATAVSSLSATDFPANAVLSVTETVAGEPTTAGVQVCYAPGSDTTGTLLRHCTASMTAPCLESLTESSGSVVAVFLSPANDPRFWTGGAAVDLKSFSPTKGAPGSSVSIDGKNLAGVQAVVIGGAQAEISSSSTNTKLVVTVPSKAVTGLISVTAASGVAVSTKKFTVT